MVCIAKLLNGNECMKYSIDEIKKKEALCFVGLPLVECNLKFQPEYTKV